MYSSPHPYLPPAEFRRRHAAWIASPKWKDFVRALKVKRDFTCAVCGHDFLRKYGKWQLVGDHKRYWKDGRLIFGHEIEDDVRLLCPGCNKKGVRSDDQIRMTRTSYRITNALIWAVSALFRALRWLHQKLWKILRVLVRGNRGQIREHRLEEHDE